METQMNWETMELNFSWSGISDLNPLNALRGQRLVLSVANARRGAGSPENYFFFKNGLQLLKLLRHFGKNKFPFFLNFLCTSGLEIFKRKQT